jgi:hypothetical protein
VVSFPRVSTPNPCMQLPYAPQVLLAPPIFLYLIIRIFDEEYRS